ncbi:MAG: biopolymer transporter ExbD [Opitutaceae bacterium]|jgi:biopolymer transport protein ExbD
MARTFRRKSQTHPIAELNVTNLIDLGFTLLIIFMIATPLINQEQTTPVNLPVVSKSPQQKVDKDQTFQAITIDARGRYLWGSQPVTFLELQSKLSAVSQQTKPPVLRIRADGKVDYQKIMTVIDEIKKRGLSKITLDTQSDS